MKLHWKDIHNDAERWYGLAVQLTPAEADAQCKPAMRIESGANGRLKLMQGETPLLWATVCQRHEGAHVLRSFNNFAPAIPPGSIDSALVEHISRLEPACRLPAWSRHFASALAASPTSFFYPGLWLLAGVKPDGDAWTFTAERWSGNGRTGNWSVREATQALRASPVSFISWFVHHEGDVDSQDTDSLVNLRKLTGDDEGRLKWWRKKARERSLPPVLLWFVDALQAYVVTDGHLRLQAAILENLPPDFIVSYSAQEEAIYQDPVKQQHIVNAVLKPGFPARSVSEINRILTLAFDDRPVTVSRTRAWARIASDAIWLSEVDAQLRAVGRLDALPGFAERVENRPSPL